MPRCCCPAWLGERTGRWPRAGARRRCPRRPVRYARINGHSSASLVDLRAVRAVGGRTAVHRLRPRTRQPVDRRAALQRARAPAHPRRRSYVPAAHHQRRAWRRRRAVPRRAGCADRRACRRRELRAWRRRSRAQERGSRASRRAGHPRRRQRRRRDGGARTQGRRRALLRRPRPHQRCSGTAHQDPVLLGAVGAPRADVERGPRHAPVPTARAAAAAQAVRHPPAGAVGSCVQGPPRGPDEAEPAHRPG